MTSSLVFGSHLVDVAGRFVIAGEERQRQHQKAARRSERLKGGTWKTPIALHYMPTADAPDRSRL